MTGYSYLWKPAGGALSELGGARVGLGKEGSFLGGVLCNSVVFTWGFVEMLVWFWVSGCLLPFFSDVVVLGGLAFGLTGRADLCGFEG